MGIKSRRKIDTEKIPDVLEDPILGPKIRSIVASHLENMVGESLIKIMKQLDFWYAQDLSQQEMIDLTGRLVRTATVLHSGFECPKVRFGRTDLQMPILTCGTARMPQTYMPDTVPVLAPKRRQVLGSPSQRNLMQSIRLCLKMGINHFETARLYGTVEYQLVEALDIMMRNGEITRKDFIFQTKIGSLKSRKMFERSFYHSWKNVGDKLGYIDLLTLHCISKDEMVEWVLSDDMDMPMAGALQLQREGKIRHIGFSTHGSAEHAMRMVESNKFAYVNLHCHFFGSYHAEGTPDTKGFHGNRAVVKRALELDMGVLSISPLDKGGALYQPSKTLAKVLGPTITPIEFGSLEAWKKIGYHTISIGFARPSDLHETFEAARMYATKVGCDDFLEAAEQRVRRHMEETLGEEWESDMLNLPWCEDPTTDGVLIGHHLWLHNLMGAFGMYDFCRARYKNLEKAPWNPKRSLKENVRRMTQYNMGRAYSKKVDYTEALKDHASPDRVIDKMMEAHDWLCKANKPKKKERRARGWEAAYDLRSWETFPGDTESPLKIVLQNLTFGLFGAGGGPTESSAAYAAKLRRIFWEARYSAPPIPQKTRPKRKQEREPKVPLYTPLLTGHYVSPGEQEPFHPIFRATYA